MQKIIFYCQYLTGMGHLVPSTEIVRHLAKGFQVCLINAGPHIEGIAMPTEVECIDLPALWFEGEKSRIPASGEDFAGVKERRRDLLIEIFDRLQPDGIVTELFPFGRHQLLFELLPWLAHIKATAPATKIACSLRDTIDRSDPAADPKTICDLANQYFDLILFHSDPHFWSFAETFPHHAKLNCEVRHTGLISKLATGKRTPEDELDLADITPERPIILTSIGGGKLGYELLETTIATSWILEECIPHCFQIFTGPFLPQAQFNYLKEMAAGCSNVRLRRFTPRLLDYLEKADLFIGLTSHSTTMNILKTGVRSLIASSGDYDRDIEQLVRMRKLKKFGIAEAITTQDLQPTNFARRIQTKLRYPPAQGATGLFDLQGVQKTAAELQELLAATATVSVSPRKGPSTEL